MEVMHEELTRVMLRMSTKRALYEDNVLSGSGMYGMPAIWLCKHSLSKFIWDAWKLVTV